MITAENKSILRDIFYNLKDEGIFWSYDKNISFEDIPLSIFIEYVLKYGEFEHIILLFSVIDREIIKEVWKKVMLYDKAFIRTNLMLARIFFNMDVEKDYFLADKHDRRKKIECFTP